MQKTVLFAKLHCLVNLKMSIWVEQGNFVRVDEVMSQVSIYIMRAMSVIRHSQFTAVG